MPLPVVSEHWGLLIALCSRHTPECDLQIISGVGDETMPIACNSSKYHIHTALSLWPQINSYSNKNYETHFMGNLSRCSNVVDVTI